MPALFKQIFHICLLTKGPQDLPFSITLFRLLLAVYFVSGILTLLPSVKLDEALMVMLVDMVIMLAFAWGCLQAFKKQPRFVQMVSAMTGVGILFNVLALPLLVQIEQSRTAGQIPGELSFLLLFLLSWNLAVYAHIFRESFNIRLLAAFVLTLAYKVIEISLSQILFPQLGA